MLVNAKLMVFNVWIPITRVPMQVLQSLTKSYKVL